MSSSSTSGGSGSGGAGQQGQGSSGGARFDGDAVGELWCVAAGAGSRSAEIGVIDEELRAGVREHARRAPGLLARTERHGNGARAAALQTARRETECH